MHHLPRLAALLFAAATLGWTGAAGAQDVAAAEQACAAGSDQKPEPGAPQAGQYQRAVGITPTRLPGAVTVSPREARCLMDRLGDKLVVIQAMRDDRELPRAVALPGTGTAGEDQPAHREALQKFEELSGGDKDRPLLLYCHHSSCHLSYNAALRAVRAGYRKVYWLRAGNAGWVQAGYALKDEGRDGKGLPANYGPAVHACDQKVARYGADEYVGHVLAHPTAAALEGAVRQAQAQVLDARAACLRELAAAHRGNDAVAQDVAVRLGRNEQDVANYLQAVRGLVDKDPAGAFGSFLEQMDVADMQGVVDRARAGTSGPEKLPVEAFEKVVAAVQATERFTCARQPGPRCLPDATWRRVAAVATPANAKTLHEARARQRAK